MAEQVYKVQELAWSEFVRKIEKIVIERTSVQLRRYDGLLNRYEPCVSIINESHIWNRCQSSWKEYFNGDDSSIRKNHSNEWFYFFIVI